MAWNEISLDKVQDMEAERLAKRDRADKITAFFVLGLFFSLIAGLIYVVSTSESCKAPSAYSRDI